MATRLEIYNASLNMVSTEMMVTEMEQTAVGNACRSLFPARYEAVLGKAAWTWALKRVLVTGVDTDGTAPEFDRVYPIPSDFIKMIGWGGNADPMPKRIEGESIYSDQPSPAILIYVSRADVSLIRGPFLECIELKLAAELASKFMRDEMMARRIIAQYQIAERDAIDSITEFVDLPGRSVDTAAVGLRPSG